MIRVPAIMHHMQLFASGGPNYPRSRSAADAAYIYLGRGKIDRTEEAGCSG